MTELNLWLADEDATVAAGRNLARAVSGEPVVNQGLVIFLHGTLGAGKTTLSRGFIRGLGHQGSVKSPTYTLVEPYEDLQPSVWHFDLYRLGDPEELEYMGIRDYLAPGNVCLVEWPERGQGILPTPDLELTLAPDRGGRILQLTSHSGSGQALLGRLAAGINPASEQAGSAPTDQQ